MIAVAAPVRARRRLLAAADGPRPVVHRGPHALYVDLDGLVLGLVSARAVRVPCALWTQLPDLAALADRPVHVADGTLHVGGDAVVVARLVETGVPALGPDPVRLPRSHGLAADPLPSDRLPCDRLPDDGRLTPRDVATLVGWGPGLTPLGDDVLAGWLVTRHAAGRPDAAVSDAVRRRLGATTLLSATLLECALHGEALPELGSWLAVPGPPTAEALLRVGATSGAGLMAGARLALRSLAAERRVA